MKTTFKKKILLTILSIILLTVIIVVYIHNVPKKVTTDDIQYIELIIPEGIEDASDLPFEKQIELIQSVQENFFDTITFGVPIPNYHPREPKNLFESGIGSCFDNSRTLEKAFIYLGFQTRHVAIYTKHDRSFFTTFFTQHPYSHASLEVKTQNGWLIVDSNYPWIAMDTNGEIYNMRSLMGMVKNNQIPDWINPLQGSNMKWFYEEPAYFVYGLYSRHGKFYPPYTFLPDYNVSEFLYNFCFF